VIDIPPQCVDCSASAPTTNTAHTLISAQHGWRLARRKTPEGQRVIEWRCPRCWLRYKSGQAPPAVAEATQTSPVSIATGSEPEKEHLSAAGRLFSLARKALGRPNDR
jgi:hypothetical protein